jgi:uncharacterized membrane protein
MKLTKRILSVIFALVITASLVTSVLACGIDDSCGSHGSAAATAGETNWLLIGGVMVGVAAVFLVIVAVSVIRTQIAKKKARDRAKAKLEARKAKKEKRLAKV